MLKEVFEKCTNTGYLSNQSMMNAKTLSAKGFVTVMRKGFNTIPLILYNTFTVHNHILNVSFNLFSLYFDSGLS